MSRKEAPPSHRLSPSARSEMGPVLGSRSVMLTETCMSMLQATQGREVAACFYSL